MINQTRWITLPGGLFAALLFSAAASGATINFTLWSPHYVALPPELAIFRGEIANTGPETVFLNDAVGTLSHPDLHFDYTPFLTAVPRWLGPGEVYAGEIFGVWIPLFGLSTYGGEFAILGGADAHSRGVLGTESFSIVVDSIPEPGTNILVLCGLSLAGVVMWRHRPCRRRGADICPREPARCQA